MQTPSQIDNGKVSNERADDAAKKKPGVKIHARHKRGDGRPEVVKLLSVTTTKEGEFSVFTEIGGFDRSNYVRIFIPLATIADQLPKMVKNYGASLKAKAKS